VDSSIQVSERKINNLLSGARTGQGDREYHIAQILIALPEDASQEQLEAAREKTREVLEQLRQGADFKRLAMTVSDGRQALEGGDLGWRRADQLPSLFAGVVPRLQAGQVSDPIRSPSGFHIVKVLDGKGGQQRVITQTHARHILIKTSEVVSDEDAQLYLQRLHERSVNGRDFGELARARANDPASAVKGGDLGWINPGEVARQFEEKMNALQPGEISEPFKTPFGWHIVQVIERRQQDGTLEAQRAAAYEALYKRKSEEEWEQWLRQLRDEAYVEIRL
jgi:peptidyl-prolyl cis-trans isomerase SurA